MDTNYIRDLLRMGAQNWTEMAVDCIIDALDELDERTRPEGTPEPGPDTCDCGICSERRQGVSTIPGCFCGKCRHAQFVDEGKYWTCGLRGSPAYAVVSVPVDFGCTLGERREAE